MDETQLKQMIDACRPGRDDLRLPEMAALADDLALDPQAAAAYERSRNFDAAVSAAFRDAPVPAGLEERLLAAVEAAGQAAVDLAPSPAAPVEPARPLIFRRSVLSGMAAAAALLIMAGVYVIVRPSAEVTPAELVARTQEVLDDGDFATVSAWDHAEESPSRPFPQHFLRISPDALRQVDTGLDRRAVAYRIPVLNKSAYLFVIDPSGDPVGLGGAPSKISLPGPTGGWKMTAWTAKGLIYVLAYEGDLRVLLTDRPTA